MKPAFLIEGRTITHSALFKTPVGMPGRALSSSFITYPASFTRSCSFSPFCAMAVPDAMRHRTDIVSKAVPFLSQYRITVSPLFLDSHLAFQIQMRAGGERNVHFLCSIIAISASEHPRIFLSSVIYLGRNSFHGRGMM